MVQATTGTVNSTAPVSCLELETVGSMAIFAATNPRGDGPHFDNGDAEASELAARDPEAVPR
jgi:hypothetical protein